MVAAMATSQSAAAAIAGCIAVATAAVQTQPDTFAYWMPQSEEYAAYLTREGLLGPAERDRLDHPRVALFDYLPGGEFGADREALAVRILFVDATRGRRLSLKVIDEALFDLNSIYGVLPENDYDLGAVSFCARVREAPQPFRYRRGRRRRRDESAFDYAQWTKYLRQNRRWFRGLPDGDLPVVVTDGNTELLGFSLGTPTQRPGLDAVAISLRVLRKDVRGRETGKMLAHLVANHLGLRPLWHPEHDGGDLVADTPPHNAPNVGTLPRGEHLSLAPGFPAELTDNVMDNTADRQGVAWTPGQVEYVVANLLSPEARGAYTVNPDVCPVEGAIEARSTEPVDPGAPTKSIGVEIAPNPVDVTLSARFDGLAPGARYHLQVVDQRGRVALAVGEREIRDGGVDVAVADLPAGSYWLTLRRVGNDREAVAKRFTKL